MSDMLDMSELLSVSGLPGVSDADGNELVAYEPPEIDPVVSNPDDRKEDLRNDYSAVRDNVHFQQQLLRMAAMKAFENASTSDSPRMMEVFATLLSQMTNNNKQILDIQKQMKDITQEQVKTTSDQPTINATGPVYVGSPTDLMKREGGQIEVKARNAREQEIIDVKSDNTSN